jgi:cytochrome c553
MRHKGFLRPTYSDPDLERFSIERNRQGIPLRKICDSWGLGLIRTEGMPYSNDLRLRVLAAVDGGVPVRQVAALLRVSVSYIYKALNLLFGLGSISMAGVEQAIAWQAHIGGFLAVSWHSPHSIPFRSRRAAARMKAWTRRPQRSILIRSPAALCSQCHGAQGAELSPNLGDGRDQAAAV